MSRRISEFAIKTDGGELKVKIYEVRPKDLYNKLQKCIGKKSTSTEYQDLLDICCNLTVEQLAELYPSEMEVIIQHFKEINKAFLAPWPTIKSLIEKVGLAEWAVGIIEKSGVKEVFSEALITDWKKLAHTSLKKDI